MVLFEPGDDSVQEHHGPAPLVESLGGHFVRRLVQVAALARREVQGKRWTRTAALRRVGAFGLLTHEAAAGNEQEGTKASALPVGRAQGALFEEGGEERLRQIAGVFWTLSAAADERIQRIPVGFAKNCERSAGVQRTGAVRGLDQAPACRG